MRRSLRSPTGVVAIALLSVAGFVGAPGTTFGDPLPSPSPSPSPSPAAVVAVSSELAAAASSGRAFGPGGERATVFAAAYRDAAGATQIEIRVCDAPTSCERWHVERDATALEMAWDGIAANHPFLRTTIDGIGLVDLEFATLSSTLGEVDCEDERVPVAASVVMGPSLDSLTVTAFIEGVVGKWQIAPDPVCGLWATHALFTYGVG